MKLNLRTLLVLVVGITSLSVIYQTVVAQLLCLAVTLLLLLCINPSRHRMRRVAHRLSSIGRIILTVMVFQVLFRHEGQVLWQWHFISITSSGLSYGVASSLRFFLIIMVAGLLFDIPYYEYLQAFHAWRFPNELSFLAASTIHFIPIFRMQFLRSLEALSIRGIKLDALPLGRRPKVYLSLLFPVLAKAISDVKYRAISLELRGFRLHTTRTLLHQARLTVLDVLVQGTVVVAVAAIVLFH
jgi:energy-coupling factor transport system permease protein